MPPGELPPRMEIINTKVRGVTRDGRQKTVARLRPKQALRLTREPANPADPNAIAVNTTDGKSVGYLSADLATRMAPLMDKGYVWIADVLEVTGGDAADGTPSYGCNIVLKLTSRPKKPRSPSGSWLGRIFGRET